MSALYYIKTDCEENYDLIIVGNSKAESIEYWMKYYELDEEDARATVPSIALLPMASSVGALNWSDFAWEECFKSEDVEMMVVLVREISSPYPPVYPEPLLYDVPLALLGDEVSVKEYIANKRLEEIGGVGLDVRKDDLEEVIYGLRLIMAFPPGTETIKDWRN